MSKYCVTGSAGRIGRAIYDLLSSKGHRVIGIDRIPSPTTDIVADLRDIEELKRAFYGAKAYFMWEGYMHPMSGELAKKNFGQLM